MDLKKILVLIFLLTSTIIGAVLGCGTTKEVPKKDPYMASKMKPSIYVEPVSYIDGLFDRSVFIEIIRTDGEVQSKGSGIILSWEKGKKPQFLTARHVIEKTLNDNTMMVFFTHPLLSQEGKIAVMANKIAVSNITDLDASILAKWISSTIAH